MSGFVQHCEWINDNRIMYSNYTGGVSCVDFVENKIVNIQPNPFEPLNSGFFTHMPDRIANQIQENHRLVTESDPFELIFWRDENYVPSKVGVILEKWGRPTCSCWSLHTPGLLHIGHENNCVSEWTFTNSGVNMEGSFSIESIIPAGLPRRKHLQIRAIYAKQNGEIYIAGETGVITVMDTKTHAILSLYNYSKKCTLGMNDFHQGDLSQYSWGTSCTKIKDEPQLYCWRAELNQEGFVNFEQVGCWVIKKLKQGFRYANRVLQFTWNKEPWILVSLGDGSLRFGKLMIAEDREIDIKWEKVVVLEEEGGAELSISPDRTRILTGLKHVYVFDINKLLSEERNVIQNPKHEFKI